MKIIFFAFFSFLQLSIQDCFFIQENNDEITVLNPPGKPFIQENQEDLIKSCPYYKDKEVCCSEFQSNSLVKNFALIDNTFGNSNDGCDICAINLKMFWCEYTCNPKQSEFIKDEGKEKIDNRDIWRMRVFLNMQNNCELFNSCKYTKIATLTSAMNTAEGFVKYQGYKSIDSTCIYIIFETVQTEKSININYNKCSFQGEVTESNYQVKNKCGCDTCLETCSFTTNNISILNGFKYLHVVICYSIILVLTVLFFVIRKKFGDVKESIEGNEDLIIEKNTYEKNEKYSQAYENEEE